MDGGRILDSFEKQYKVTGVKKTNISGNFSNIHNGDIIKIWMFPGDKKLRITVYRGLDAKTFDGYAGNIQKSLAKFEVEEMY